MKATTITEIVSTSMTYDPDLDDFIVINRDADGHPVQHSNAIGLNTQTIPGTSSAD